MAGRGILFNTENRITGNNGGFAIGDTEMQEVASILEMNQGEHKFIPVLGPNLVELLKSNASKFDIEQRTRVHLAKDGKDYETIKNKLKLR